jgi:hypothetical protein
LYQRVVVSGSAGPKRNGPDQLLLRVLKRQHLAERSSEGDVVAVVRDLVGLHATSATTPYLSLLARMEGFTKEQLESELYERRTLVKVRCMRSTVFVLPSEWLGLAFAATGGAAQRMSLRYLQAYTEVAADYARLSEAVLGAIGDGSKTVAEIRAALGVKGSLSSVVNLMCDQGLLIRDRPAHGWRDSTHRYARLERTYPGVDLRMDESRAATEIVRRYLQAYGPVRESDVAWWTGLTKARVRCAVAALGPAVGRLDEGLVLEGDGAARDSASGAAGRSYEPPSPTVALLPQLDPFVMGYKDRSRFLSAGDADFVFDRSGNASSTILVDGRIVGVWDSPRGKKAEVRLFTFRRLPAAVRAMVEKEAARVGLFVFEREADLVWIRTMVPLRDRPAGAVMTPLA